MIVDIETATNDLTDFICYDALAINEDRLKALTNFRIILESSSTTVDQLRFALKTQQAEIQELKRKLTKARVN